MIGIISETPKDSKEKVKTLSRLPPVEGEEKQKKYYLIWRIEIKRLSLQTERTSECFSPSLENSLEANGRFISSILLRSLVFSIGVNA